MSEADRVRDERKKPKGTEPEGDVGLECPRCGCGHFHVLYTRATVANRLLRRRQCRHCGRRITTYETAEEGND